MKIRWVQFIGIFASLLCILWIVGLGMTFAQYFTKGVSEVTKPIEVIETTAEEAIETTKIGYHIVALGDSLTTGAGDLEGKGYVGNIVDQLAELTTEEIILHNFAVNGLTSDGLLKVLKQREVQEELAVADIIFMTIGGNDLFQGGQTLLQLNLEEIELIKEQYLGNLTGILTEIRNVNTEAPIYFSGLYHPFAHLPNVEITTSVILNWNYLTALELAKINRTVFVPMFDIFQFQLDTYLSEDRFHPSSLGYQQMANRIAGLLSLGGDDLE
ncbi:GDSL family lipase [Anaerobacillus alkaliphilus]|uniref:GDSL family lipase n=1 Tax=Anaerobacillus alkaliphilus TaxID=1548597 RepID=A0A4Q0VMN9_9BACI|nr:GDSL-type esterase/lipase family protein [Anaerobacillus alkaliphilus]RXI95543.1 GDSL family lipase [Anaerobacillus alkaliphilus]